MMWHTTMNPETRRLIKVVPDDIEQTQEFFDILLATTCREGRILSVNTVMNTWICWM